MHTDPAVECRACAQGEAGRLDLPCPASEEGPATGRPASESVLAIIRAIPRGQVAGYGEVARRAGLPGRARWVARLLGENTDRSLPWHRVVRSDGRIAFPAGSEGYDEQCQRLRSEGVKVQGGRVRGLPAAATLDAQIWGEMLR